MANEEEAKSILCVLVEGRKEKAEKEKVVESKHDLLLKETVLRLQIAFRRIVCFNIFKNNN